MLVRLLQYVASDEAPQGELLLLKQVLKVLVQLVQQGKKVDALQRLPPRLILTSYPLQVTL